MSVAGHSLSRLRIGLWALSGAVISALVLAWVVSWAYEQWRASAFCLVGGALAFAMRELGRRISPILEPVV